ncbi:Heat shock protein STI [Triticum urartu]|uniref:Heat shock protein STI n=1 Tax=Triticum urartu TaxID=4572 RepID=M7Z9N2_TRIUA|nr:Heat shock protein STI [Triticum urartu]
MFQGPELWTKIASDPATRAYLDQPDFMQMLREVQRNPSSLNTYLSDPRMMQVLSLMLNIKIQTPQDSDFSQSSSPSQPPPQQQKQQPETKAREMEPEPQPEPMEVSDEEKERKERKAAALKEKEAGNASYKKKDFETAIQHYTKALELDDEDISYLTNRAAVYIEMGKVRFIIVQIPCLKVKDLIFSSPLLFVYDWLLHLSFCGICSAGAHHFPQNCFRGNSKTILQQESARVALTDKEVWHATIMAANHTVATSFAVYGYCVSIKYDECIEDCDKAVERGRELRADFKMVARALTRKGTALAKLAKNSKDYDIAIETFQKALTEHRNPDTLKRLNEAEKAKKDLEQQEYYDPKLADEEREKGNEMFKQQKYPEAIKHYNEAIRRNPKDARVYSNRAACYTKLGAMPEGLKDAEKCIELDPTFTKGYTRKGAVQFFMKEYEKAMETYQAGLKLDPNNQELLDGIRRCVEQINKANRGDISQEDLQEKQSKAMQDPEIQNILTDPIMRQVLMDFQENPRAAQDHLKDPGVAQKIQKLINAGIVQTR